MEPSATLTGTENSTVVTYRGYSLYCSDMQGIPCTWSPGGKHLHLMDINQKVTIDELTAMAQGLIDLGRIPQK